MSYRFTLVPIAFFVGIFLGWTFAGFMLETFSWAATNCYRSGGHFTFERGCALDHYNPEPRP
jgi:hypothetical protein